MFANAKAQAWWALRDRFLETFKASRGEPYEADAIISPSLAIEERRELKSQLSQVTYTYNPAGATNGTDLSSRSVPRRGRRVRRVHRHLSSPATRMFDQQIGSDMARVLNRSLSLIRFQHR